MACTQITPSSLIKDKSTRIMFSTYLGIYCQGQTQPLNIFIEITKDDLETGSEVLALYHTRDSTKKYNIIVSEKRDKDRT